MNSFGKNLALWIIIGLLLVALFNLFQSSTTRAPQNSLAYSDLINDVNKGQVREVTIQGNNVNGKFADGRSFSTYVPNDPNLVNRLIDKGVQIHAAPADDNVPSLFGILISPALLVLLIMRRLHEPERWLKLAAEGSMRQRLAAYWTELFSDPRWLRHAILGLILASSGIIGLWAIGFFSIDLQQAVFRARLDLEGGLSKDEVNFQVGLWASITSMTLNIGAFFGIYAFTWATHHLGRRPVFAAAYVLALASTAFVFWNFNTIADVFWMIPIMGFCQLMLFGGYAIYFPELFPTRLRSTGTSFCYNGGRFVAALAPSALGLLHRHFTEVYNGDRVFAFRLAGVIMCSIFLVGLIVLPFAPETRGKPLPD